MNGHSETLKISQTAEKWKLLLVENITVTFDMEKALCEYDRSSRSGFWYQLG
jgi:hypothetical protein